MIEPTRKCDRCQTHIPDGKAFYRGALELIGVNGAAAFAGRFDGDLCSQACVLAVIKGMLSQEPPAPDNGGRAVPVQVGAAEELHAGVREGR